VDAFGFILLVGAGVIAAIVVPPWWRARSLRARLASGALDDDIVRIRAT
jgi:hypothetical protein